MLLARLTSTRYVNTDYLVLIKMFYWLDYLLIPRERGLKCRVTLKFIAIGVLPRVKGGTINNHARTTGASQEIWSWFSEVGEEVCKITTESEKGL